MIDWETAYAKINLALHIRRRRDDGYHDLETIFAFTDQGDRIGFRPSTDLSLSVSGPFGAGLTTGPDNLVWQAAETLRATFSVKKGAHLHIVKQLPIASGIGGGSADAAAALRILCRHWEIEFTDQRVGSIAAKLGADVHACLGSRLTFGSGVGDQLSSIDETALANMPILLVNPGINCPTAPVFAAWDGVDRGGLGGDDPLVAALAGRNDLELSACSIVPEISALLTLLADQDGVILSRMSGSGATCFALFNTAQEREKARRAFIGYWTMAARLR